MMTLLDTLASYVPKIILHRLKAHPGAIMAPFSETHEAATLFADISGFTPLTERLARSGPAGAERLAVVLNDYFGQLIETVNLYGGDIVKFAGDALLAIWPDTLHDKPLAELVNLAAQCALQTQQQLRNYKPAEDLQLSLRMGIGIGEVFNIHLGGQQNRWEFFLTGPGILQASEAEKRASPGRVAVSAEAWRYIQENFNSAGMENGFREITSAVHEIPALPLEPTRLPPELEAGMRAHIPGAILARLSARQSGWLAELRRVTILFVNLPDLGDNTPIQQAQEIMQTLQDAIYYYEGSINKLNVDDKGVTLIAVNGLPPLSHEDDAIRGVQTALELKTRLDKMNLHNSIGVTTGLVFCGTIGNDLRREYTIMGDVVNLAARLMMASTNDLLCDEPTFEATKHQLTFDTLPAITVKGKTEPIAVFRPSRRQNKITFTQPDSELVGRYAERAAISGQLQAFLRGNEGGLILLEGEAGIGKSRLLADLISQANKLGLNSIHGYGDAIEKLKPYHAFRPAFKKLFFLDATTDSQIRHTPFPIELFKDPELANLLPLLNDILPFELPPNDLISQMSAEVRAENTRKLINHLIQLQANKSRLMLVLDDAHWMDSSSWAAIHSLIQNVSPLLIAIATRPIPEPVPPELRQIYHHPNLVHLKLSTLPPEEILGLVNQSLGIKSLPDAVADLIMQKAQGNPFFSQELAYSLRDAGILRIMESRAYLAPEVISLSSLNLPDTVQGAIISRVDRLGAQEQFALKVASVIGRIFAYTTLHHIYPINEDKPNLIAYLQKLEELDITPLETPDPDLSYIFKHNITQEVVYNLLPFSRREELHHEIAAWFEELFGRDLSPYYPILAHHWSRANNPSKSIEYLEKAGTQALLQYANQEVLDFFSLALEIYNHHQEKLSYISPLQLGRWERQLGEAYLRLGQLGNSEQHLRKALDHLKISIPKTDTQFITGLLGQVGLQLTKRFRRQQAIPEADKRELILETARVYHHLSEIYFFDQKTAAMLYTNLRTINSTEPAGPSPDLAEAYGSMGVAAGLIPLHKVARYYLQSGQRVAQSLEHLPSMAYTQMVDSVYYMGLAEWDAVQNSLSQSIEKYRRLGDSSRLGSTLILMADLHYLRGEYLKALPLTQEVHQLGRQSGSPQQQAWGLGSQAEIVVRMGHNRHAHAAVELIEEALLHLKGNPDLTEETRNHGTLSLARLRQGEYQLAYEAAEIAQSLITKSPTPTLFSVFEGYAAPPEVYLTLWALNPHLSDLTPGTKPITFTRTSCKTSARRALKNLHLYARTFPIGKPRAALWQGYFDWLDGKRTAAFRKWQKGLELAQKLGLVWETGRLHFELGRRMTEPAQKQEHFKQAVAIFERLGAEYDLHRANREIAVFQE